MAKKDDEKVRFFYIYIRSFNLKASFESEMSVPKLLARESVVGRTFLVGMQAGPRRTSPKATILAGGGADTGGAG